MTAPFLPEQTPIVILAEGCFGAHESKTAMGVLRYGSWPVIAVLDSAQAGRSIADVIRFEHAAPIVASLQEALTFQPTPKALLIGTAPMGGGLPENYRNIVKQAITAGLHVISGLHVFLNEQPDLRRLAEHHGVVLWDVREPSPDAVVTRQLPRLATTKVLTMVGTDCSVGKMSAGLHIHQGLQQQGVQSAFVATGQTGIMITGAGLPLDRVIGDFMAGQLEREIDTVIQRDAPQWVIVEGQGSLLHPAYSGVTLALLHGSAPDVMVLCHNATSTAIRKYEYVSIPPLYQMVTMYEQAAAWVKPAKVMGICLNTSMLSTVEAQRLVAEAQQQTGLPTTDPVRFGVTDLLAALLTRS